MLKILCKNVKPYLRVELFYRDINSIADLRKLVLKRELLNKDLNKMKECKKYVHEIVQTESDLESDEEIICELERKRKKELICWNCRIPGHGYQECLQERTIFCYGCGAPDKYKPTCENCLKNPRKVSSKN
jgi:hypothetical protein